MIIKLKKREFWIFLAVFLVLLIPIVYAAASTILKGFGVEVFITNTAPVMALDIGRSFSSADPTDGSTTLVWFIFNVTDDNGEDDVDTIGARFNLTLGGIGTSQFRYNSTCSNVSKIGADNRVVFNCSVRMFYFDNSSSVWVINGTANDTSNSRVRNDTNAFTYNVLTAVTFPVGYINFTTLSLNTNNQPTGGARLILNNTGNDDIDQINITGANLFGVTTTSESIGVGQFAVNYTNAVDGSGLALTTGPQVIPGVSDAANLTLNHGHSQASSDYNDGVIFDAGNQSLYFWVDVPASGLSAQKYNNTWNMTFVNK